MSVILDEKTSYALDRADFVGIIEGLSNDVYHSLKGYVSSSQLKFMHKTSPAHYYAQYLTGAVPEKKTTDKMHLGSYVHEKFLTPGENTFFVMPEYDARTKEGKAIRDEALEVAGSRICISKDLGETGDAIVESLKKKFYPELESYHSEVSIFWRCPFSQLYFKARADGLMSDTLLELKTTESAHPETFSRHAYNMNYDLSLYHYMEGLKQCGREIKKAVFIVSETTAPYVCEKYTVGDGFLATGHEKWLKAVTQLEDGLKNQSWPSYVPDTCDELVLNPPKWALSKELIGEPSL